MKWEVIFIYFFKYPVFMGIIFSWKFPIYFLVLPISTCKKKKKILLIQFKNVSAFNIRQRTHKLWNKPSTQEEFATKSKNNKKWVMKYVNVIIMKNTQEHLFSAMVNELILQALDSSYLDALWMWPCNKSNKYL